MPRVHISIRTRLQLKYTEVFNLHKHTWLNHNIKQLAHNTKTALGYFIVKPLDNKYYACHCRGSR